MNPFVRSLGRLFKVLFNNFSRGLDFYFAITTDVIICLLANIFGVFGIWIGGMTIFLPLCYDFL